MKNHFTKESFVIIIFSFQVQPRKAIGKMILFPLICTRLTEKCRKFQGKNYQQGILNQRRRGNTVTKQLNSHIWSYSGHIKPLLMGKEERKKLRFFRLREWVPEPT